MILLKCNVSSAYFFTGFLILVLTIVSNISSIQCQGLQFHRKTSNNTEINIYFPTVIVVVTDTWPNGTSCEQNTSEVNIPKTAAGIQYLSLIHI